MTLIFNTLLPVFTLSILNYLTYKAMSKSIHNNDHGQPLTNSQTSGLRSHGGGGTVRKREARITKASIGITVMYLICHTPRVIPNLYETAGIENRPSWLPILVSINHLLITINSSFNFLFYLSYCWIENANRRAGIFPRVFPLFDSNEILYYRTPGAYNKYTKTYGVTLFVCIK